MSGEESERSLGRREKGIAKRTWSPEFKEEGYEENEDSDFRTLLHRSSSCLDVMTLSTIDSDIRFWVSWLNL